MEADIVEAFDWLDYVGTSYRRPDETMEVTNEQISYVLVAPQYKQDTMPILAGDWVGLRRTDEIAKAPSFPKRLVTQERPSRWGR